MYRIFIILLSLFVVPNIYGQHKVTRSKKIAVNKVVKIDSLSLVYNSVIILDNNNQPVNLNNYKVNYPNATIYFNNNLNDSLVTVIYKVLPYNFSAPYLLNTWLFGQHQSSQIINAKNNTLWQNHPDTSQKITTTGIISRGIGIGNNQNLTTTSDMNLQINGQLADGIFINAAISDKNIPLQPDGYSQKIDDFDRVIIKIHDSVRYIEIGDIELNHTENNFMRLNRKLSGAKAGSFNNNKTHFTFAGAVAKGTYNRIEFNAIEGVLGPYQLYGANHETYIVILAGSEKIYIDGQLLQRGDNADYTINYNTAEITFTIKNTITTNSRIIAEFQYSDKNYNRFLLYGKTSITSKNSKIDVAFFSENDAKNQPVNQNLSEAEKEILANAGNNTAGFYTPNFDSIAFDKNLVLYKLTDTIVNGVFYDSVFVCSVNPANAYYTVGFALVGQGKGNYVVLPGAFNGRAYKWVAPINNVKQGNYEPVTLLIAPQKKQMLTFSALHNINKNTNTHIELAFTNADKNTFSNIDNDKNFGMAIKTGAGHIIKFKNTDLNLMANYELVSNRFSAIERFRAAEFERDFNILSTDTVFEQLVLFKAVLNNNKKNNASLNSQWLKRGNNYNGIKNDVSTNISVGKTTFTAWASLLNSKSQFIATNFYRHNIKLLIPVKKIILSTSNTFEFNRINYLPTDSLLTGSNMFVSTTAALTTTDSSLVSTQLLFTNRIDYINSQNSFEPLTNANQISFINKLNQSNNQQLQAILSYRKTSVYNNNLTNNSVQPDQNFNGRIDYSLNLFKRSVSFNLFYETATELETRKEFIYIEVAKGQGVYVWVDYNTNGAAEIDEFEIAAIPQEANYLRITTQTNQYVKVYSPKLNATITTNFNRLWHNSKGVKKFISMWGNNLSFRSFQKHNNNTLAYRVNPFYSNLSDTNLLSSTTYFRNILSFNKTNPVFGADWVYSQSQQKTLLSYGADNNIYKQNTLKLRWNIKSWLLITNNTEQGIKEYKSQLFAQKNFNIKFYSNNFETHWQPNTKLRVSFTYKYTNKQNTTGNQLAQLHQTGPGLSYATPRKGSLLLQINAIKATFNQPENTSIAYEMLEGNLNGLNFVINANLDRKLNQYLKLTLNYTGRFLPDNTFINTGQITLSAIF